jgi:hypothetical protein
MAVQPRSCYAAGGPAGVREEQVPLGYHWKELFLTLGTWQRIYSMGPDERAEVTGDQLPFRGGPRRPTSCCERFATCLPANPGHQDWM